MVFGACVLANTFFYWSAAAWLDLFGPPPGLIAPLADRWLIMPLALLVWVSQFASYAALERIESLAPLTTAARVALVSLFSTALYAPLVLWCRRDAYSLRAKHGFHA